MKKKKLYHAHALQRGSTSFSRKEDPLLAMPDRLSENLAGVHVHAY